MCKVNHLSYANNHLLKETCYYYSQIHILSKQGFDKPFLNYNN